MKQEELARYGAIAGISGAVLCNMLLTVSIWLHEEWRFGMDFLSELGAPGPDGWIFNLAIMVMGGVGIVFAMGLYQFVSWSALGKVANVTFGLSCVFLFLIGVFPIDTGDLHDRISWTFFVLVVLALMMMTVPFRKRRTLGRSGSIATVATVSLSIVDLMMVYLGIMRYQLCEALVVLALTAWTIVTSVLILFRFRTDRCAAPS